jgi:HEAT repeat protein
MKGTIVVLREIVSYPNIGNEFCKKIIDKLAEHKDKESTSKLIKLAEENSELKYKVIEALVKIGDEKAIPFLVKDLKNNPSETVIEALGELKAKSAVPSLAKMISSVEYGYQSLEALIKISDPSAIPKIKENMDKLTEMLDKKGYGAYESELNVKTALALSANALGVCGKESDKKKAMDILQNILENPSKENYGFSGHPNLFLAARAMLNMAPGNEGAIKAVEKALKSAPDPSTEIQLRQLLASAKETQKKQIKN